jgi:hypothetical protein
MFLKIHHSPDRGDVVAVCDRELLNTTLRHERFVLTVTETFYGNIPATEEEVSHALSTAGNINLIGERSVGVAIRMGLLTEAGCIMIGAVPHAQIYEL